MRVISSAEADVSFSISPILRVAALVLMPVALAAQGVSGQLSILEKAGVRTGDLSNSVVWLESPVAPGSSAREPVTIAMEGKQFIPHVQVVGVGGVVEYPNHDPFRHNVFSKSGPAEFDLGLYARGDSKRMQFERAGVYPIFCNIHAKMVAYVLAVPSPHMVRPGADGRFAFAGVPPGNYVLKVWHERGGVFTKPIAVPGDGANTVMVQLDARSYQLVPHKNKFGANYTTSGSERY
jgi:plastocyanin